MALFSGRNEGDKGERVVAHLDMDCFYCQVEHVRLGIPTEVPLAVQQWQGLIATNYAARKLGVRRGTTISDAKKACPDIKLIHVELIGENGESLDANKVSRAQAKVTLRRYRNASTKVMEIFARIVGKENMQRTSVDEAYLDLTNIVQKRMGEPDHKKATMEEVLRFTHVFGTAPEEAKISPEMLEGARVTDSIRKAVRKELKFTVSAGIAVNKIVAKLASAKNKPDKQTIIPRERTKEMMHALPITDVPGLGGKLGKKVQDWIRTLNNSDLAGKSRKRQRWGTKPDDSPEPLYVNSLAQIPPNQINSAFGTKIGSFLLDIASGIDNSPVVERDKRKSLLAFKSFEPISEMPKLEKWLRLLSNELIERAEEDKRTYARIPTRITLYHRGGRPKNSKPWDQRTKTITRSGPFSGDIYNCARALLDKVEKPLPCTRIAVGLEGFTNNPAHGTISIEQYFKKNERIDTKKEKKQENSKSMDESRFMLQQTAWPRSSESPLQKRTSPQLRTSHEDPNFLEGFFKASRLHFIGTWKERFEEILDSLPNPPPLPSVKPNERRYLHVDMDCFFASVAVRDRPSLVGKPVVVCWSTGKSSRNQSRSEISSANYVARKFGVRAGMRLYKAKELCPGLVSAPYEFQKYTEAAEKMYRIVFDTSPHVEGLSCDECFLDITHLVMGKKGKSFEIAVDCVANKLRAKIKLKTGCVASIGCGHNRLMARIATKKAKPNGYFKIIPTEAASFLSNLSVSELPGVGYRTERKLKEHGITKCADILAKPMSQLKRLLGNRLSEAVFGYARGIDKRPWQPRPPRRSVGAQVSWGVRFKDEEEVYVFLTKLCNELVSRMERYDVKGRSVNLKLWRAVHNAPHLKGHVGHGICDIINRTTQLKGFTRNLKEIETQVHQMWKALKVHPTEVRGLGIQVSSLNTDPRKRSFSISNKSKAIAPAGKQTEYDPENRHSRYAAWYGISKKEKKRKQDTPQGEKSLESSRGSSVDSKDQRSSSNEAIEELFSDRERTLFKSMVKSKEEAYEALAKEFNAIPYFRSESLQVAQLSRGIRLLFWILQEFNENETRKEMLNIVTGIAELWTWNKETVAEVVREEWNKIWKKLSILFNND